jgi:RNA polymerase sigma-70 factor, ECF subfamily
MASPLGIQQLVAERARFVSFVKSRVADRQLSEDIVQSAMAHALQDARPLEGVDLTRWFYRVLRNAVVDRHRRGAAESGALERLQLDPTSHVEHETARRLCGCVTRALHSLDPKLRDVLDAVELRGLKPGEFARVAGISAGNAAVRVHRARRKLAETLKSICGSCTLDGCSDCDCGHRTRPL